MQEQTMPSTATPFETNPDEIQNHESAKNWTKPIVFSLVGVLLAAGLVFAGINIGKNQQSEQQPVLAQPTALPTVIATNPTALPSPTAEPNLTIDPAADWKIFEGELFTFKYPGEFQVVAKKNSTNDTSISLSDGNYYSGVEETTVPNRLMDITVSSSQNKTRTDYYYGGYKWASNMIEQFQTKKLIQGGGDRLELLKTMQVDGQEAIVFSDQFTSTLVVTKNSNYSVVIHLLRPSIDPNKEPLSTEVFDQIISTFKFKTR